MSDWSINIVSEDSLLLEWDVNINENTTPSLSAKISGVSRYLRQSYEDVIINVTPAYRSTLIQFDVLKTNHQQISELIVESLTRSFDVDLPTGILHQIPVFYDSSVAADLDGICLEKNISVKELIELHTSVCYDVYVVGFLPGFAYLGYIPEQLQMQRHRSFRSNIPAGSVAVADRQTAVYPTESPGGWQVIGRTPKQLLENYQSVLQSGDRVRFSSITQSEFLSLGGVL